MHNFVVGREQHLPEQEVVVVALCACGNRLKQWQVLGRRRIRHVDEPLASVGALVLMAIVLLKLVVLGAAGVTLVLCRKPRLLLLVSYREAPAMAASDLPHNTQHNTTHPTRRHKSRQGTVCCTHDT